MLQFAFLNNRFKWFGLSLLLSGFILNAIAMPDLSSLKDGKGLLVQVMILFGLLIIICSKQKMEDEYINHIRLISLQWAVILLILLRLIWKTLGFIYEDESWMPQWQVNSMLQFYLLFFYYAAWLKDKLPNFIRIRSEK